MSVLQEWTNTLPLQQQSVLMLALRGPDGDPKHTAFKELLRAYRGTVLKAAKYGRPLNWGEKADSFMSLDVIADSFAWEKAVEKYLDDEADGAVLHHYTHFMHAAQIVAYKHPDDRYARAFEFTYRKFVDRLHLNVEPVEVMNERLGDWGHKHWEK